MACCKDSSADDERQSALIDAELQETASMQQSEVKMLLLGTGESGKSTVFKQMKLIHKDGWNDAERREYIVHVRANLVVNMKVLLHGARVHGLKFESEECQSAAARIDGLPVERPQWNVTIAEDLVRLWASPTIANAFQFASQLQLSDSAKYFFENIPRIMKDNYVPTDQDILRVRIRTTAVVETEFHYGGLHFRMTDVGGQRNERRKWIHCFQDVTAIIFCVSLSEYDQVLAEDSTTNRMEESLVLFEEMCNLPWFHETPIILFLNKTDIFKEKIAQHDIRNYFPDYSGGSDFKRACDFVRQKFLARNKNRDKEIYTHFTCATDTRNIKLVFQDVRDIITQAKLRNAGFF